MKIILAIFFTFFFFYGMFSLFKGVNSAGQINLTAESTDVASKTRKISVSLPPKKNETKKDQNITSTATTQSLSPTKAIEKTSEKIKETPNIQNIKATITFDDGLIPGSLNVKVNVPVRFEIDPKDDGEGCMSTIMIPGLYDEPILVQAGKKIVMEFTPKKTGLYDITCAMGVPWGDLSVK